MNILVQPNPGGRGNPCKKDAWPHTASIDPLFSRGQGEGQSHQMDMRKTVEKGRR